MNVHYIRINVPVATSGMRYVVKILLVYMPFQEAVNLEMQKVEEVQ